VHVGIFGYDRNFLSLSLSLSIYIYIMLCKDYVRWVADKHLARPERRQDTVNKLVIYSTYSTGSSVHFLARSSYIREPLKIKIKKLSVKPDLGDSIELLDGRKTANFQLFFSLQETDGISRRPDPENRVRDEDTRIVSKPLSSGL